MFREKLMKIKKLYNKIKNMAFAQNIKSLPTSNTTFDENQIKKIYN